MDHAKRPTITPMVQNTFPTRTSYVVEYICCILQMMKLMMEDTRTFPKTNIRPGKNLNGTLCYGLKEHNWIY